MVTILGSTGLGKEGNSYTNQELQNVRLMQKKGKFLVKAELIYTEWLEKASLKKLPIFKPQSKGTNPEKQQPGKSGRNRFQVGGTKYTNAPRQENSYLL